MVTLRRPHTLKALFGALREVSGTHVYRQLLDRNECGFRRENSTERRGALTNFGFWEHGDQAPR